MDLVLKQLIKHHEIYDKIQRLNLNRIVELNKNRGYLPKFHGIKKAKIELSYMQWFVFCKIDGQEWVLEKIGSNIYSSITDNLVRLKINFKRNCIEIYGDAFYEDLWTLLVTLDYQV